MASITYGLRVPSVHPSDPKAIREFVIRAEALGFDSIWVGDHVFYNVDVIQPLHLLTWISAQTSRVKLGTAVMLSAYLNPVLLARSAASLDHLSGGRLMLGVSIGGTSAEYESIGVPQNQRVGRLLESVEIMRRLWREDGVSFSGRYHQVHDGTINPKPSQQGGVPIYFGAVNDAMLRRIARTADGWIGSAGSIQVFLHGIQTVRRFADEIGRAPDSIGIAKLQSISVASTSAQARRQGEDQWKAYYGPNFNIDAATIYGTADESKAKLAVFTEADCPDITLVLEPAGLSLEQLETLAAITVHV